MPPGILMPGGFALHCQTGKTLTNLATKHSRKRVCDLHSVLPRWHETGKTPPIQGSRRHDGGAKHARLKELRRGECFAKVFRQPQTDHDQQP
jgi:hypothetical protein